MSKKGDGDYALAAVAPESKKGFFSLFPVMLGFTFFSASMWTGGTLGTGLSAQTFLLAVLGGNLILGVYTCLLAYMASDTGLSTHLLAKYAFGEKGSYLVSFILGITQVGWFGVGVAMFALPVQKVTGLPLYALIGIAGILMTATAYFGMKSLTVLSIIAVPSIAILGSFSVSSAVDSVGGLSALFALEPAEALGFTTALTLCVGSFISGGTLTPDFTRFSKSKSVGVSTTMIAFFIGNSLMFIFGAVGAAVMGEADISEVMFKQGIILPAIIVLGFNIWTTNDNALYASSLGFSNITKLPKNKVVIFNGLLGTVGAMFLYNNFVGYLTVLSSLIPAIGGILISDYFLVKKKTYAPYEKTTFAKINPVAIGAWVIGVLCAHYVPGIPPINGVVASALTYTLVMKFVANTSEDVVKTTA
ncbi:cytosine permease [Fusibacter sp. JL298sf-3]